MTATVEDYYDGFRTFSWLADFIDVPVDQVRNLSLFHFFYVDIIFLIYLSTAQNEGASIEVYIMFDICMSFLLKNDWYTTFDVKIDVKFFLLSLKIVMFEINKLLLIIFHINKVVSIKYKKNNIAISGSIIRKIRTIR